MNRNFIFYSCLLFFATLIGTQNVFATHVEGGELTYQHIGDLAGQDKYDYKVTLKLYRNCYDGVTMGDVYLVASSNFGNNTVRVFVPVVVPPAPLTSIGTCVKNVGNVCVEEYVFEGVMNLPPVEGGWHLTYDNGNRSATIDNLLDPLNVGIGLYAFIPNDELISYTLPSIPAPYCIDTAIWLEDFTGLGIGTTLDNGVTAWSSISGSASDNFDVNAAGEFEMDDIDTIGTWTSEWIDISNETCVNLSVDVRELSTNTLEVSDYIHFYYDTGAGLIPFTVNGALANDFTSAVATTDCVSGDSIRIVIEATNNANDEEYFIDNITVSVPCPMDPNELWYEDFDLVDGLNVDSGSTSWSTQVFGGPAQFETMTGQFVANDMDGLGQWYSDFIQVTGDTFNISVFLEESGDLESDDYVKSNYSLDGGNTWIYFDINSSIYDDFDSDTAYVLGLYGADSVIIRIDFDNNASTETHYINGVHVQSTSDSRVIADTTHMVSGTPNSSAYFINPPTVVECAGQVFTHDHSALDTDGDSLVYRICTPYNSWNTTPWQTNDNDPPNFGPNGNPILEDLTNYYQIGYSALEPFGNDSIDINSFLAIDSMTGVLSGYMPAVLPGATNEYVIAVCVDEYRDDSLIGTVARDIIMHSVNCQLFSPIIYDTVCHSFTSPTGKIWDSSNIYMDTVSTLTGCDSVVIFDLVINNVDTSIAVYNDTIVANATGTYQWLDCDSGNVFITNETNQTFIASTSGTYSVIIETNNCMDTSRCVGIVVEDPNSIEDNDLSNQLSVSPNPNKGLVHINFGAASEASIAIFNIYGQIVLQERVVDLNNYSVPLNGAAGVYYLRIIADGYEKSFQLIKN